MRIIKLPLSISIKMAFIVTSFISMQATATENTLSQLLKKSLTHTESENSHQAYSYQTSEWLAASPSASVSYIESQDDLGANELEIGVNLAIKSGLQRKIDQQLSQLAQDISGHQIDIRKLYLSGMIRESIWSYQLAKNEQVYIQKKISVLNKLQNNSADLVNAGESSDYGLLLIKKELVDTQIELLENNSQLNFWLTQYQTITGELDLPEQIVETAIQFKTIQWQQHPQIKLIEDRWQQNTLILQATSSDAASWSVGFSAKNIETQSNSDTQIGLSFEMPLNIIEVNSHSIRNQSQQNKKQFDLDYQKLTLGIKNQINQLSEDSRKMKSKMMLLESSFQFSQKIMHQIDRLKLQNEMGQELILRRVLDGLKTQNQLLKTKLMIKQNNSMARQAAGLSL